MATIAFMTRSLEADRIWKGVVETAGGAGVNLMVFYGDMLSGSQSNIVYELISRKRIDGVITWASSDQNEYLSFYDKLGDIPLVSLSLPLADKPLVAIDNVGGMKNLINHLITAHGRGKIAFIKGPENHIYAQERFQAYKEALADHRIAFDNRLVFQGTWDAESGREACLEFFGTRKLAAGKDIDAIVCVHDHVSLAVAAELKNAGIRIPEDISLTGYDNTRDAHSTTPGLTTMEMPFYEQGEAAVRIMLDMIRGKSVSRKIRLDSRPVIRSHAAVLLFPVMKNPLPRPWNPAKPDSSRHLQTKSFITRPEHS